MNLTHLALIAGLLVVGPSAFGQGDTPDSCDNRYDGTFSSFILDNSSGNGQIFDIMANPNMTVNVFTNASYAVNLVMHMPATSSQNNTDPGSTWYHETATGFADGHCVPSVSANDFIPVSSNYVEPSSQTGDYIQHVEFATFSILDNPVTYNIHWVDPNFTPPTPDSTQPSIFTLSVNSQDSFSNNITGYSIILYASNGTQIGQGFTPTTFTLDNNTTYFVSATSFGSFVFDHWGDDHSTNPSRQVSISSDTTLTAIYRTIPQAPTSLVPTAVSSSQINLSWAAPSNDGGSVISGYMIERSANGGSTWSTVVLNSASTTTTYSNTGLAHSTTYTYRASAINSVGTSQPSNTASATTFNTVPTQPTGLTATAQLLNINLSWHTPSDNGGTAITGYKIDRSTNGGSTWSTIVSNTGTSGTTYSDTNVLPLTTYTYHVSAINDIGIGNPSNSASASTPSVPSPPVATPTLPALT